MKDKTPKEKTLLFFDDYFKSIGLEYMLFASTLLGIVRDGKLLDHDAEIDLCVLGSDLTDEMIEKLKNSKYFLLDYKCREKIGEMYFSEGEKQSFKEGWIAISSLWVRNGQGYINMLHSDCVVIDKKYNDKKNWGTLEYIGRKFKCPLNPEEWLKEWYGKDWKTPKKGDWHTNKNRKTWEEI